MGSVLLALALLAAPPVTPPAPASAPAPLVGVAPALTVNALRDELRARSQQRQEELAALARQRAELERLGAEIAAARAALDEASQRAQPKDARTARPGEKAEPAKKADARTSAATPGPSNPEALARTVKGMKADQAAALIVRLDRSLAVDVLRRMRPSDAGSILDRMKGETAAELFSAMAVGRGTPTRGSER